MKARKGLAKIKRQKSFVVISILIVALVYSSFSTSGVFAVPPESGYMESGTCGGTTTNPLYLLFVTVQKVQFETLCIIGL
jgi:hypothetical protein